MSNFRFRSRYHQRRGYITWHRLAFALQRLTSLFGALLTVLETHADDDVLTECAKIPALQRWVIGVIRQRTDPPARKTVLALLMSEDPSIRLDAIYLTSRMVPAPESE